MSLPHIILGMLRKEPKSGYDLKKQFDNVIHYFWDTDLSRIYKTLDFMKNKGWVEFEYVVQEESPNKKIYSVTEKGREELQNWLAEPGKPMGHRNAFLAQLHFSDVIPADVQLHVLLKRLETLRAQILELQRRAEFLNIPIPLPKNALQVGLTREMFSLEYGIRRYQFEIEWTENIIRVLRNAPSDG